jgi:hypothetical protein
MRYGAHVCARCILIDCRDGILSRKGSTLCRSFFEMMSVRMRMSFVSS